MEDLIPVKDSGIKNMESEKFEEAIADFTKAIDGLDPKNDNEAVFKCTCLANRSGCYLAIAKREEAANDANAIIEIYQKFRPEDVQAKMTAQTLKEDKLTIPLSLAFIRRGNVFESQLQLLEALQQYAQAIAINFEGSGQMGMRSILQRLGVPEYDQNDPELKPFADLLAYLLDPTALLKTLTDIVKSIREGGLDEKLVKKYNTTGCCRIIYGIIQLYLGEEVLVLMAVTTIRTLVEKGVADLLAQALIMRAVAQNWSKNAGIMGAVMKFLILLPPQLFTALNAVDFMDPIIRTLDLELNDEEKDAAYYLLFQLPETQEHLGKLGAEGAVSKAIAAKSRNALVFLSKACQLRDNRRQLETESGGPDWIFDLISKNPEDLTIISAASILITQIFMGEADDKENGLPIPSEEVMTSRGKKTYELLFPVAKSKSKEINLVSNIFAALASCVEYAKDYIKENRVVQAASAILTMNDKDEGVAVNIISLFYACSIYGLIEEVKQTRSAMPTIMATLAKHSTSLVLVERAVAIACEVDHPKKIELLKPALEQNPASPILAKYKHLIV